MWSPEIFHLKIYTEGKTQMMTHSKVQTHHSKSTKMKKKDNAATKGRYVLTVTTTKQQHTKKSSPKAHGN